MARKHGKISNPETAVLDGMIGIFGLPMVERAMRTEVSEVLDYITEPMLERLEDMTAEVRMCATPERARDMVASLPETERLVLTMFTCDASLGDELAHAMSKRAVG